MKGTRAPVEGFGRPAEEGSKDERAYNLSDTDTLDDFPNIGLVPFQYCVVSSFTMMSLIFTLFAPVYLISLFVYILSY